MSSVTFDKLRATVSQKAPQDTEALRVGIAGDCHHHILSEVKQDGFVGQ